MSEKDTAAMADSIRTKLETNRPAFTISRFMFEPQAITSVRVIANDTRDAAEDLKIVSPTCLRLLLDYCENPDWQMGFVEYCAAIFHGRTPSVDEQAFDLLPDVRKKLNADRLGFGHIYGGTDGT